MANFGHQGPVRFPGFFKTVRPPRGGLDPWRLGRSGRSGCGMTRTGLLTQPSRLGVSTDRFRALGTQTLRFAPPSAPCHSAPDVGLTRGCGGGWGRACSSLSIGSSRPDIDPDASSHSCHNRTVSKRAPAWTTCRATSKLGTAAQPQQHFDGRRRNLK